MKFLRHLTVRKVEIGVACAFLALTIPLVLENIRLGPGWGDVGPEPGLFPLLMTAIVAFGALGVLGQVARRAPATPFFEERQEVVDLVKVGTPLALAIGLVPFLGIYIVSLVYTIFFGIWYGRVRWFIVLPIGVALTYGIYWALEQTFNIAMPKSLWYPAIPF